MAKIRTAIVGYGRSGSTMHAGAIENNGDLFEMTAVCDIDPERRDEAEKRFGGVVSGSRVRPIGQRHIHTVSCWQLWDDDAQPSILLVHDTRSLQRVSRPIAT